MDEIQTFIRSEPFEYPMRLSYQRFFLMQFRDYLHKSSLWFEINSTCSKYRLRNFCQQNLQTSQTGFPRESKAYSANSCTSKQTKCGTDFLNPPYPPKIPNPHPGTHLFVHGLRLQRDLQTNPQATHRRNPYTSLLLLKYSLGQLP